VQGVASSNPAAPTNLFFKIRYLAFQQQFTFPQNCRLLNTC